MLYKRFSDIGRVRDIFIPRKRDERGQRYGFVRFGTDVESSRIEEDLNKIWFASFKLRANRAKFERGGENVRNKVQGMKFSERGHTIYQPSWRNERRSYAQATTSHNTAGALNINSENNNPEFNGLRFESNKLEKDEIKKCFIGCLKENLEWSECEANFRQLCDKYFKVNYTGGDMILLRPLADSISLEAIPKDLYEWVDFIRPWNENDVSLRKRVWTRWYGVPLHAWTEKFFNLVATRFGPVIKIDKNTLNKSNLLFARVMIRTPLHKISRIPVKIMVDGTLFHIRIVEEVESDYHGWNLTGTGNATVSGEGKSSHGINEEAETSSVPCMGSKDTIINADIFKQVHVEKVGRMAAVVDSNPEENVGKHPKQSRFEYNALEAPHGLGLGVCTSPIQPINIGPDALKSPSKNTQRLKGILKEKALQQKSKTAHVSFMEEITSKEAEEKEKRDSNIFDLNSAEPEISENQIKQPEQDYITIVDQQQEMEVELSSESETRTESIDSEAISGSEEEGI